MPTQDESLRAFILISQHMSAPISISIIIPTHNRGDVLLMTMDHLAQVRIPPGIEVDLTVVANACTDDTLQRVSHRALTMPFPTRCILEPAKGVCLARNRGITESMGHIVAFLDDDVWCDAGWLVGLVQTFEQTPANLVLGKVDLWWQAIARPEWLNDKLAAFLSSVDLGDETIELTEPSRVISANLAVRREVLDRVGGFRPGIIRGEDIELAGRALRAGFRLFYSPAAAVRHWVAPHRASGAFICQMARANARDRVYLKSRFGPLQIARVVAGHLYLIIRHAPGELLARLTGDTAAAVDHATYRHTGLGGLSAAARRLAGKSPLKRAH
jgi:GT2 family glycosyltransferase